MLHTKKIYNLLFEKEDKDTDSPEKPVYVKDEELKSRKSLYSLDSQIDALILRYETSSIRDEEDQNLAEYSFAKKSLRYLFEQEEEEDPLGDLGGEEPAAETEEESTAGTEDDSTSSPTGNEKMAADTPSKVEKLPDLDVDAFTARAVRLISNPSTLLDLETVIVNRVKNFLDEHYGDEFVVRFMDTLRDEYGIEITEFDEEEMMQVNNDIFAPGANPSATGGG